MNALQVPTIALRLYQHLLHVADGVQEAGEQAERGAVRGGGGEVSVLASGNQ